MYLRCTPSPQMGLTLADLDVTCKIPIHSFTVKSSGTDDSYTTTEDLLMKFDGLSPASGDWQGYINIYYDDQIVFGDKQYGISTRHYDYGILVPKGTTVRLKSNKYSSGNVYFYKLIDDYRDMYKISFSTTNNAASNSAVWIKVLRGSSIFLSQNYLQSTLQSNPIDNDAFTWSYSNSYYSFTPKFGCIYCPDGTTVSSGTTKSWRYSDKVSFGYIQTDNQNNIWNWL